MQEKHSFNCVIVAKNRYNPGEVVTKLTLLDIPPNYAAIKEKDTGNIYQIRYISRSLKKIQEINPDQYIPGSVIESPLNFREIEGIILPKNVNGPIILANKNHREIGEVVAIFTRDQGYRRVFTAADIERKTLEDVLSNVSPIFLLNRYADIYDYFVKR